MDHSLSAQPQEYLGQIYTKMYLEPPLVIPDLSLSLKQELISSDH